MTEATDCTRIAPLAKDVREAVKWLGRVRRVRRGRQEARRFMKSVYRLASALHEEPPLRGCPEALALVRDTAPALAGSVGVLRWWLGYAEGRYVGKWDATWPKCCEERSALEFFFQLYRGTELEARFPELDTGEIDSLMYHTAEARGHLEAASIPAGIPASHWWWWAPADPPAPAAAPRIAPRREPPRIEDALEAMRDFARAECEANRESWLATDIELRRKPRRDAQGFLDSDSDTPVYFQTGSLSGVGRTAGREEIIAAFAPRTLFQAKHYRHPVLRDIFAVYAGPHWPGELRYDHLYILAKRDGRLKIISIYWNPARYEQVKRTPWILWKGRTVGWRGKLVVLHKIQPPDNRLDRMDYDLD